MVTPWWTTGKTANLVTEGHEDVTVLWHLFTKEHLPDKSIKSLQREGIKIEEENQLLTASGI